MSHPAFPSPLRRWFGVQLLLLLLVLLLAPRAQAQTQTYTSSRDDRDPPTRVARVAELSGRADWFDPENRDWQPLIRNQTLAEGDRVRTAERSRLGLRIGGHGLWLDERGELELRRLDDGRIDLDLERGALALRWLSRETAQDAQLRTRDGRFRFERAGAYRVDQQGRGSRAQVFEGRLRFDARGQDDDRDAPLFVEEGEQAELWWDGGPRAERSRWRGQDDFGGWLVAELGFGRQSTAYLRDRPSYRYVSPELTGVDELDTAGRWEVSADYGPLWTPVRVAVDWAPYRTGRWVWSRHWGWTWVDEQPWGYATSHYGRWVFWGGRWAWAPGAVVVARPVFAPALVAWVGGGHVQVGVQIGSRYQPPVAWVPLSPYERYRPWYYASPRYQQRLDPDPITVRRPQITAPQGGPGGRAEWASYNQRVPGAVSVMPASGQRPLPLRDERTLSQLQAVQPVQAGGSSGPRLPFARGGEADMPRRDARELGEAGGPPPVRAGGGGGLPLRQAPNPVQPVQPQAMPAPALPQAMPAPVQPPMRELDRAERFERQQQMDREQRLDREEQLRRLQRERDQGDERNLPWRGQRAPELQRQMEAPRPPEMQRMPELPTRRFEPPQRMEVPPPQRMEAPRVEMPQRRVEVPRAEAPQQQRQEPRRGRDGDEGPRRNDNR